MKAFIISTLILCITTAYSQSTMFKVTIPDDSKFIISHNLVYKLAADSNFKRYKLYDLGVSQGPIDTISTITDYYAYRHCREIVEEEVYDNNNIVTLKVGDQASQFIQEIKEEGDYSSLEVATVPLDARTYISLEWLKAYSVNPKKGRGFSLATPRFTSLFKSHSDSTIYLISHFRDFDAGGATSEADKFYISGDEVDSIEVCIRANFMALFIVPNAITAHGEVVTDILCWMESQEIDIATGVKSFRIPVVDKLVFDDRTMKQLFNKNVKMASRYEESLPLGTNKSTLSEQKIMVELNGFIIDLKVFYKDKSTKDFTIKSSWYINDSWLGLPFRS